MVVILVVVVVILLCSSLTNGHFMNEGHLEMIQKRFRESVEEQVDTSVSKEITPIVHVFDNDVIPIQAPKTIEMTEVFVVSGLVKVPTLKGTPPKTFHCSAGVVVNEASQVSFINPDEAVKEYCQQGTTSLYRGQEIAHLPKRSTEVPAEVTSAANAIHDWLIPEFIKKHSVILTHPYRIHSVYVRRSPVYPDEYLVGVLLNDKNKDSGDFHSIDDEWVTFCTALIRRHSDGVIELLDPKHHHPQCTRALVQKKYNNLYFGSGNTVAYPPQFPKTPPPLYDGHHGREKSPTEPSPPYIKRLRPSRNSKCRLPSLIPPKFKSPLKNLKSKLPNRPKLPIPRPKSRNLRPKSSKPATQRGLKLPFPKFWRRSSKKTNPSRNQ